MASANLLGRIEAKKFRISAILDWISENRSGHYTKKNSSDLDKYMSEIDELVDQLIFKSPNEERLNICRDFETFKAEVHDRLAEFQPEIERSKNIVPMKMELECPSFNGDSTQNKFEFRGFLRKFEFCTANMNDADKLLLLKSKLTGQAFNVISGMDVTHGNYNVALECLKEKYLNPSAILHLIFEDIIPQPEKSASWKDLRILLERVKHELTEMDNSFGTDFLVDKSTSGRLIAHILFAKFPNDVRREVMNKSCERFPSLQSILSLTFDILDIMVASPLSAPKRENFPPKISPPLGDRTLVAKNSDTKQFKLSQSGNTSKPFVNNGESKTCKLCQANGHLTKNCSKFPSSESKIIRARELKLCLRCLGEHSESSCKGVKGFPYSCKNCGSKNHYSLMCPKGCKPFVGRTSLSDQTQSISPVIKISMMIKRRPVYFFCLIDTGSQKSFFSRIILDRLNHYHNLNPETVKMPVNTLVGTKSLLLSELKVSLKLGDQQPFNYSALFAERLKLTFHVNRFDEITSNIIKKGYKLCPGYSKLNGSNILGIIGLDLIPSIRNLSLIKCLGGSAWKLPNYIIPFGEGSSFLSHNDEAVGKLPVFNQVVKTLPKCQSYLIDSVLKPIASYEDVLLPFLDEPVVERGVEKFFSLESIGIDDANQLSLNDEEKIEAFREAIELKDGKYYIELPWDTNKLHKVESNYVASLRIMHRVAQSLENQGLYKDYLRVFKEYEDCGIVESFYVPPGTYENYIWIPHRPVIKEGQGITTKIRPVFNCSLKRKGSVSINDAAYAGVNMTALLLDILIAFRKEKYVLLGDLRKAYLQIRLKSIEDKNRFCFFLKVDGKLCAYRFNTIIFGFNASPFILSFILKYHIKKYEADLASSTISNKFYVDNLVTTNSDCVALTHVYEKVRDRLGEAGFELQSCNSNCESIQNKMLEDGTITSPSPTYEKVLGYHYSVQRDTIKLPPQVIDGNANTKRKILSLILSVYDPLSLLLPVTVQGKVIISQMWKKKLSWDQIIPEEIKVSWQAHAYELNSIEDLEFPRCAILSESPVELICFSDASKLAYGFSLYAKQGAQCSLIFAKAKVAPIKGKSLPVLELLAIFLAVKVIPQVLRALTLTNIKSFFLVSDAQVALSWVLNGKAAKKNIFVENRVSDINRAIEEINLKHGVKPKFRYVPSLDNPADLLTRGITVSKFKQIFKFWTCGPEWLNQEKICWPSSPLPCLSNGNRKVVSCMFSDGTASDKIHLPIEVSDYSSLNKAINVLEKVIRFGDKLRHRKTDTVKRAKLLLFSHMQREAFPTEIVYLKQPSNKAAPPRVTALGLFLDEEGLIRTQGRIQNSDVFPYEVKFPILLGKNTHLTKLVIMESHQNCCHMGANSTLSKVRLSGFWIPQGRQAVKSVLRDCVICKRINSLPYKAPSGSQLPSDRVNFVRPFKCVGVDFTGHFFVKNNNEDVKMYILLFTCMSLRAIHLELVSDMSARSFLLAFIRFTNLFGVPTHMYSDNAKSFLASGIILSDILESDEFREHFKSTTIVHHTIPLYSAWHGGVWERLIKTVKQCLSKLLGRRRVDYFEFLTALSDVQKAINDRPLTFLSASDRSLEILTPNHFLQTGYHPRLLINLSGSEDLCPEPPKRNSLIYSLELRDEFVNKFKRIWHNDYLLSIREVDAHITENDSSKISEGEIVLVKAPNKSRPFWGLGKVVKLLVGKDNRVRSVSVLKDGGVQIHSLKNIYPLEVKNNSEPALAEFTEEGGPFFCPTCSVANDGTNPMVCCDSCNEWYHFSCVGVDQQDTIGEWVCPNCTDQVSS